MEPHLQKFSSHAEADAADRAYYLSLTPDQRMEILFDLIERGKTPEQREQRIAKVYRIIKIPRQ